MSESEGLPADQSPAESLAADSASDDSASSEAPRAEAASAQAAPAPGSAHSPEELTRALKAFKKRLKLTQLDSESKLGYGPMTGGRPSGIVAITPPNQYPRSVWDALVAQGRLIKGSHGQYELPRQ